MTMMMIMATTATTMITITIMMMMTVVMMTWEFIHFITKIRALSDVGLVKN